MTLFKLTWRSLGFYWQAHALVLAGTILTSAILVGAMLIGDSIKFSLRQSALRRLGDIHWALDTRGRFFPADLASRLQNESGAMVSPALLFQGIALSQGTTGMVPRQINNIQIVGVPDSFWGLAAGGEPTPGPSEEGMSINAKLAAALQVQPGDYISIRFSKPSLMARDAPLASQEKNDTLRATFILKNIVPDSQLGSFSLTANQQVPHTVFVNLTSLQQTANLENQANLLLAGPPANSKPDLDQALKKVWQLKDAGLTLRSLDNGHLFQLECDRIFMDPPIESALSKMPDATGTLTYLVNSIAKPNALPGKETPYSFVLAMAPSSPATLGPVPEPMQDDEIIINRWLADQLEAQPGETVRLTYFEFTAWNTFIETNRLFKVHHIVEMPDLARERELSPRFPSLTDAETCAEWDIGMPLQKSKLEDQANEAYWNQYRATPKAIVTLKAGQQMWSNRFGRLTTARIPSHGRPADEIETTLLSHLSPAELGLSFKPVREIALKAASEAMDFGQLFLGLSFFLMIASIVFTRMLFGFSLQQRAPETGLLLALGFTTSQILRLWLQECVLLAAVGAALGTALGTGYTHALIWGLSHPWQGAIANADIQYASTTRTLATGFILSFAIATGSLLLAIRHQLKQSTQSLLTLAESAPTAPVTSPLSWLQIRAPLIGIGLALLLIGYASTAELQDYAGIFFSAGSLLLISLLGLIRLLLRRLSQLGGTLSLTTLALRNAGRQGSRNLTVASLLACGGFLLLAVAAMQVDIERGAHRRDSGTGGFALFGQATLPIQSDLNRPEGQQKYGLNQTPDLLTGNIVSMKVRTGDDASCLNLNRAQTPTLIGVDPLEFERRGAFQNGSNTSNLWAQLNSPLPDGTVPGLVGDANTAQWGLKVKTGPVHGDILTFADERGGLFRVKLVGTLPVKLSVFQGSILISTRDFTRHYPAENGARMFLLDARPETAPHVQDLLTRNLEKWGLNLTSTTDRLKLFYAVEKTYLAMFLVLGGLGILLSTAGMTIVILRNIQERRDELALLSAAGYSSRQIHRVLLTEFGVIMALGLTAGALASLTAIWPALQAPGLNLPWPVLTVLISGMILVQTFSILLALRLALRTPLLAALRNQ